MLSCQMDSQDILTSHMQDQLLEILSRLFNPGRKKNSLLYPKPGLEQVIRLQSQSHLITWVSKPEILRAIPLTSETSVSVEHGTLTPSRKLRHHKLWSVEVDYV